MDEIRVRIENDVYIEFIGEELAYSLDSELCITHDLYKTNNGKFICITNNSFGDNDEYKSAIVSTEKEVIDFFGLDDPAIRLYEEAGIKLNVNCCEG